MKTKLLFLFSLVIISFNSFCQPQTNFDLSDVLRKYSISMEDNLLFGDYESIKTIRKILEEYRDVNDLFLLDSTVSYEFLSELDSVATVKQTFYYDNQHNLEISIIEHKSANAAEWVNISKVEYLYNDNKSQSQIIRYDWVEGEWIYATKFEFYYNSNNLETEQSNYDWDNSNNIWVNTFRIEYKYNSQNLQSEVIIWIKNFQTNLLEKREKYEFYYTNSGQKNDETQFMWDSESLKWTNYHKLSLFYGPDVQSNDYYTWDSTEWKPYKHYGYRLDSLVGISNTYSLMNDTLWLETANAELGLNPGGEIVYQESYRLYDDLLWIGDVRFNKFYSNDGKYTGTYNYIWSITDKKWNYDTKNQVGYNVNNFKNYLCSSDWNENTLSWEKKNSKKYYYRNVSSIDDNRLAPAIELFPNPCRSYLTIKNDESILNDRFQIINLSGEILISGIYEPNLLKQIDVSKLRKGLYILRTYSSSTIYAEKFVKY